MGEIGSRLKDMYCKMHGCDHIIMTNNESKPPAYESSNHFAVHERMLFLMEQTDPHYDFVFCTGTDQAITNLFVDPSHIVPEDCRKDSMDIFAPVDKFTVYSGVGTGHIMRNTPEIRQFLRDLVTYEARGHYVISDQTAFNHLLLRTLATRMNKSLDALELFERGKKCDMYLPQEYYSYKKTYAKQHWKKHQNLGRCLMNLYTTWYGKRPFTKNSPGRHGNESNVCLFEDSLTNLKTGGQNWNARFYNFERKHFMYHAVGKKTYASMQNAFRMAVDHLPYELQVKVNESKSAVYDRCVKKYTTQTAM